MVVGIDIVIASPASFRVPLDRGIESHTQVCDTLLYPLYVETYMHMLDTGGLDKESSVHIAFVVGSCQHHFAHAMDIYSPSRASVYTFLCVLKLG
jgi:hypothetical protein